MQLRDQFLLSFRERGNRQAVDTGTALVLPDMFPGFGQIGPIIDLVDQRMDFPVPLLCSPPVPIDASGVSSMPVQGLSQSELVRTSVMYLPVLRRSALPHSTGPSPSARPFGSVRRRHSKMTIRDLLL